MGRIAFGIKTYAYNICRELRYLLKPDTFSRNRCLTKIQLYAHVVEKGLSMHPFRLGFGHDTVISLVMKCEEYAACAFDVTEQPFLNAVALVKEYRRVHEDCGFRLEDDLCSATDRLTAKYGKDIAPLHQNDFHPDGYFSAGTDFREFAYNRHSLRDFGEGTVPEDLIRQAVDLAATAPSACNRQAVRVHLLSGETLKKVMEMHRGSRGFGDKADKLLIVTVDISSYFGISERNLPPLDAGIFVMNLLYALHYYEIGACALNWCLPVKTDKAMRELTGIPDNESVELLIACGRIPDREFRTARSEKLTSEKILTVH